MKNQTLRKACVFAVALVALLSLMTVATMAETLDVPDNAPATSDVGSVLSGIFTGTNLALLGAALAVALPCMGSAKGVGIVGEATGGLLSENPNMFGKALALQALPMTQGVYGMVAAFLILNTIGLFGGMKTLTMGQGAYFLMASLPIALAGFFSAVKQGRVAATGIQLLCKRPGELGHAVTSAALVETYAIFSLLITLLMVVNFPA